MNEKENLAFLIKNAMKLQVRPRWISCNFPKQSVAEHSFNVMCLYMVVSRVIIDIAWDVKTKNNMSGKVLDAKFASHLFNYENIMKCLFHDVDEAKTGDIPKPIKDELKLNDILDTTLRRLFVNNISTMDKEVKIDEKPLAYYVMKLCDYIEAFIYVNENYDNAPFDKDKTEKSYYSCRKEANIMYFYLLKDWLYVYEKEFEIDKRIEDVVGIQFIDKDFLKKYKKQRVRNYIRNKTTL